MKEEEDQWKTYCKMTLIQKIIHKLLKCKSCNSSSVVLFVLCGTCCHFQLDRKIKRRHISINSKQTINVILPDPGSQPNWPQPLIAVGISTMMRAQNQQPHPATRLVELLNLKKCIEIPFKSFTIRKKKKYARKTWKDLISEHWWKTSLYLTLFWQTTAHLLTAKATSMKSKAAKLQ